MNPLAGIWRLIKTWPVRAQGVIVAGIAVGTSFGLGLTVEQVGAIIGFTSILLMFVTESAVTSKEEPTLAIGTPMNAGSAVVASVNPPPAPTTETPT